MMFRYADQTDVKAIQTVIQAAFPEDECDSIIRVAAELSLETCTPPVMSLVAERDGQLTGYVSISPVFFRSDTSVTGYILAPLAVSPSNQSQGVGKALVHTGAERLARDGVDVLFVYGDPGYYGQFGFTEETARSFIPPYRLTYPSGWLGMTLNGTGCAGAPITFGCVNALSKPDLW